jgi:hypothetical protein
LFHGAFGLAVGFEQFGQVPTKISIARLTFDGCGDSIRRPPERDRFGAEAESIALFRHVAEMLRMIDLLGERRQLDSPQDIRQNVKAVPISQAQAIETFFLGQPGPPTVVPARSGRVRLLPPGTRLAGLGQALRREWFVIQAKNFARPFRNGSRKEVVSGWIQMDVLVEEVAPRNSVRALGGQKLFGIQQ